MYFLSVHPGKGIPALMLFLKVSFSSFFGGGDLNWGSTDRGCCLCTDCKAPSNVWFVTLGYRNRNCLDRTRETHYHIVGFYFFMGFTDKKTNIEKRYDSSFKCGSVPLWRRSRRHDISNNHCMQTHAVVNHALTSQSIETCIQIHTETACLLCLQWWEIKIHPVEKCHRCIQISTHQLYIRKWAHKHTHTTHSHGSEVKCARFWTHIYTHRRWEIQP